MDNLTLILSDDETKKEITCEILNVFEIENRKYISLLPTEQMEDQGQIEIQLYRYEEDADQDRIQIIPIISDLDYDEAPAFLETLLQ